jgi:membrane protease YdiL (CAAX protease family)
MPATEALMTGGRARTLLALLVFAGWILITIFSGVLTHAPQEPQPLNVPISQSVQINLAAAVLFMVVAIVGLRWWDIGLNAPRSLRSLRVLWFPGLYLAGFLGLAMYAGFPPRSVLLVILANTALAGISEELACRGVLYKGLRATLSVWPSILLSSLLFGAVHVLNGLATGDFVASSVQAVAAFMTGIAFMGIRIRTGSLYPAIVVHALWDFLLIAAVTGMMARFGGEAAAAANAGSVPPQLLILPVAVILPNFLYGLYLLRRAGRDAAA